MFANGPGGSAEQAGSVHHCRRPRWSRFFTVYQDAGTTGAPTVEVEFLQAGKSLTKRRRVRRQGADEIARRRCAGRIPYLMTIPAESIPSGSYEIRPTARKRSTTAGAGAIMTIE